MKQITAVIAALALSISLAGCGSDNQSNQASAIRAACELAKAKDFNGTKEAFAEIAANDSGYIGASMGASAWANAEGGDIYGISYIEDVKPIAYKSFREFNALCIDLP
jgi:hypothetical protein